MLINKRKTCICFIYFNCIKKILILITKDYRMINLSVQKLCYFFYKLKIVSIETDEKNLIEC